jgi:hypothetical protein
MKKQLFPTSLIAISMLMASCSSDKTSDIIHPIEAIHDTIIEMDTSNKEMDIQEVAIDVLTWLRELDFDKLNSFNDGRAVVFSPYSHIDTNIAVRLSFDKLAAASRNSKFFTWGISDGEGEPIFMSVPGYFDRFVNDVDYLSDRDELNVGVLIQRGNSIANANKIFPFTEIVEFYRGPRNPDMAQMDWRALSLIFERIDGRLFLVAVVHNEWTI